MLNGLKEIKHLINYNSYNTTQLNNTSKSVLSKTAQIPQFTNYIHHHNYYQMQLGQAKISKSSTSTNNNNNSNNNNAYNNGNNNVTQFSNLNFNNDNFENADSNFNFSNERACDAHEFNENDNFNDLNNLLTSYSSDEDDEIKYNSQLNASNKSISSSETSRQSSSGGGTSSSRTKSRRSLPTYYPRRVSTITCSTTTDANGMPIIEEPPSRLRSLSLKTPNLANNIAIQSSSLANSSISTATLYSSSLNKIKKNPAVEAKATDEIKRMNDEKPDLYSLSRHSINEETLDERKSSSISQQERKSSLNDQTSKTLSTIMSNQVGKTSDYDSGESPNSSDYNSDTDKLLMRNQITTQDNQIRDELAQQSKKSTSSLWSIKAIEEFKEEILRTNPNKYFNCKCTSKKKRINGDVTTCSDTETEIDIWKMDDIQNSKTLERINEWNFPIFQFSEHSRHHVLSQVTYNKNFVRFY
jgi:hypothetical protein